MNSFIVRRGKSLVQGLKGRHAWWLMGAGALALASLLFGSLALGSPSAQAGGPTPTEETPTEEAPTATPIPGSIIFVGTIDEATTPAACGPGDILLTVSGDQTELLTIQVIDFPVAGSPQNQTIVFDPPIAIAGDGTFSQSGPLPPPLDAVTASIDGTFDFAADPLTVAGTLNVAAGPTVLCDTTYFAEAGVPTPTPPPPQPTETPAPATTATVAATALPATGSSSTGGSGSDTMLWTALAAIAGVAALSAAGAAVLRRRA